VPVQQPVAPVAPANGANGHVAPANGAQAPAHAPAVAAAPQHAHAPAAAPQQHHAAAPVQQARPAQQQARPAQQRAPARRPVYEESQSGISEVSDIPRRGGRRSQSATVTIGILVLAMVGGALYFAYGRWRAGIVRCVNSKLAEGQKELRHDSYDGYKKAIDAANAALDCEPKNGPAHGMLAYAHAIRWGEHGSADDRAPAEEHLVDAIKHSDKPQSFTLAAEALVPYYSGDSKKALDVVAKNIERTNNRSATLLLTQGIILMNDGDLDGARDSLEKAQQLAQDDARVYTAMGMLNRRRGFDREALQNFDTARRFEKNHADAILGMAQLVLDLPDPGGGYITQAKELKSVIDAQPPVSPRQQAMAHALRALLISRVSNDLPLYPDVEFQKKLASETGAGTDKEKNKATATAEENQAFSMDQKNPELFLIRGKRLYFERNLDAAAAEMRKAISMNAARVHFHIELAKVLFQKQGGENEVEQALRKALTAVPDNPKLQTMLGQVLAKEKRPDDAISVLEKAVKTARDSNSRLRMPEAFYTLGQLYRDDKHDVNKAIENMRMAGNQAFGDPALASQIYDDLAQLFEGKGDKSAAHDNYEKAVLSPDENPAALCHFVHFMVKGGDAKDKDNIKELSKKYVGAAPKGECAGELKGLAQ
jgi:tetratricopeptide (TPR) repeat protein